MGEASHAACKEIHMNPTPPTDIASLLDTASPALTLDEVEELRGKFSASTRRPGARGRTGSKFSLRVGETHYVLKVSNPAESRQVIDFQTRALLHIAQVDPELPVPRSGPTLRALPEWVFDGRRGAARRSRSLVSAGSAFPPRVDRAPRSDEISAGVRRGSTLRCAVSSTRRRATN